MLNAFIGRDIYYLKPLILSGAYAFMFYFTPGGSLPLRWYYFAIDHLVIISLAR